jgi:hypothetical protein
MIYKFWGHSRRRVRKDTAACKWLSWLATNCARLVLPRSKEQRFNGILMLARAYLYISWQLAWWIYLVLICICYIWALIIAVPSYSDRNRNRKERSTSFLGTLSAYVLWLFGFDKTRLMISQPRPSTRNERPSADIVSTTWSGHLASPFLGLPRTVSVCALLLHAPYLFPHTRLPTGIIACTHGSPVP